jgi:hypothetical protein
MDQHLIQHSISLQEMKEMQDKMSLLSNDCNQIKASLDTAFANTDQVSRQLMDLKKKR